MLKLRVPKMTCGGCVRAVENAVRAVDLLAIVEADLPTRTVTIRSERGGEVLSEAGRKFGYDNAVVSSAPQGASASQLSSACCT